MKYSSGEILEYAILALSEHNGSLGMAAKELRLAFEWLTLRDAVSLCQTARLTWVERESKQGAGR